ncbi:MAG: hypothetical protein DWH91_14015 [Planctomycetota bacterium]|nr:MAG: hypothetical protein DWH91_14015 [Planctomycetota bacterium]
MRQRLRCCSDLCSSRCCLLCTGSGRLLCSDELLLVEEEVLRSRRPAEEVPSAEDSLPQERQLRSDELLCS